MVGDQALHRFAITEFVEDPLTLLDYDGHRKSNQQQCREIELQEQRLLPQWHGKFGEDPGSHSQRERRRDGNHQHRDSGAEPAKPETGENEWYDGQEQQRHGRLVKRKARDQRGEAYHARKGQNPCAIAHISEVFPAIGLQEQGQRKHQQGAKSVPDPPRKRMEQPRSADDLDRHQPAHDRTRKGSDKTGPEPERGDAAFAFDKIALWPQAHQQPRDEPAFEDIRHCQRERPGRSETEQRRRRRAQAHEDRKSSEVVDAGQGQEQGCSQCRSHPDQRKTAGETGPEDRGRRDHEEQRPVQGDPHRGMRHGATVPMVAR